MDHDTKKTDVTEMVINGDGAPGGRPGPVAPSPAEAAASDPQLTGATAGRRGPRTERGRKAVRHNAVRHGLAAASPVIPGEDPEAWERHRAGIVASLAPVGGLEAELANRVAMLLWRQRRVVAFERHQLSQPGAGPLLTDADLDAVIRFESHLGRQLLRAFQALAIYQGKRGGGSMRRAVPRTSLALVGGEDRE